MQPRKIFWWETLKSYLIDFYENSSPKAVLDAGCGNSTFPEEVFPNSIHFGVDKELSGLKEKKNYSSKSVASSVARADIKYLPVRTRFFDLIVLAEVGGHSKFWDEAYRVLKDGGIMFVDTAIITRRGRYGFEKVNSFPKDKFEVVRSRIYECILKGKIIGDEREEEIHMRYVSLFLRKTSQKN